MTRAELTRCNNEISHLICDFFFLNTSMYHWVPSISQINRKSKTFISILVRHLNPKFRPDSHRTLTLKLPLTLKYCLMHFYQSIHTVWARSTLKLTIKSKYILRGAMSLSVPYLLFLTYFLVARSRS